MKILRRKGILPRHKDGISYTDSFLTELFNMNVLLQFTE